jgi:type II secretory pathway component PulK
MRIQIQSKPRGIALIIVMIVIVTFGILAGGFAYSMKVETKLARNASMDTELEWMGRSGIELAKWVLSQPAQGGIAYDALNQKWAGGTGETNDALADVQLDNYPLGRGSVAVRIEDMERKFNINTITPASRQILEQALSMLIGLDAAEAPKISGAILDWMDADDDTQMGASETESSYYMSLNPPYRAKNGPIDDLTELMMIHGITPAMYYGSGGASEYTRALPKRQGYWKGTFEEPVYPVGFKELFTTLSSGRININTASATVLQIFPLMQENFAQAIVSSRLGPNDTDGLDGRMAFRSVADLGRIGAVSGSVPIPPEVIQQMAPYLDVRSTTFEVHVTAQIGDYHREFVSILRRDGRAMQSIYLYWR